MRKTALIVGLLALFCISFSTIAFAGGTRHARQGYAVPDSNTVKEIRAIKLEMQAMEREIKFLKENQTKPMSPIELGKIEGRLTWAENQINKLWKWVIAMAILIGLILVYIVFVLFSGNRRRQANI